MCNFWKRIMSGIQHFFLGSKQSSELTFVGSTSLQQFSSLSTVTVDMSGISDLQSGDYIICCISLVDAIFSDLAGMPSNDSSGSGLSLENSAYSNGTNDTLLAVYVGAYTGTLSSGNLTFSLLRGNRQAVTVHVFRGVDASTPIANVNAAGSTTDGRPNPPSAPNAENQFIFAVGAMNGTVSTTAVSSSDLTEFVNVLSGSSRRSVIGAGYSLEGTNPTQFTGGEASSSATNRSFTYTLNRA